MTYYTYMSPFVYLVKNQRLGFSVQITKEIPENKLG